MPGKRRPRRPPLRSTGSRVHARASAPGGQAPAAPLRLGVIDDGGDGRPLERARGRPHPPPHPPRFHATPRPAAAVLAGPLPRRGRGSLLSGLPFLLLRP